MSKDDILYLLCLLLSIPLGHLIKISGSAKRKQFLTLIAGLFTIFLTSGIGGLVHSFCTIVGTFCLVKFLGPR